MADSMQPLDPAQFTAFTAGDEQALARLYRAQYDGLLAAAGEALGPDLAHFSGRVAQRAMLAIWQGRGQFQNVDGLTSALREATLEEATVQRRKHSALHHGHASGDRKSHVSALSADQAVAQLLSELHVEKADHAKSLSEVKEAQKHHAAQHVQAVGKGGGWKMPVALVVVLGTVIVLGMQWANKSGVEVAVTKALAAEDARTLSSQRGQRGTVDLSDGSKAKIGLDSRLRLPVEFGTTMRTLQLTGTASFTVAAGQPLPFTVRAGNAIITAAGTRFTVRAFEEDSAVVVGVEEGSVSVRVKDKSGETALEAGKAVRVSTDGTVQPLDDAARAVALSWVRDTLDFVNAPVSVALPELIRWFDLRASLADPALGTRTVTMQVGLQSSGDALKALATAANLSIGFDKDDKVVLTDAGAAPAAAPAKKK